MSSENQINSAAEARRKRFLEAKKASGGNAEDLIECQKKRPWRLFFDADGTIHCFTQEENFTPSANWLTHDFQQDQLEILIDKDLRKYMVCADPKVDNLYSIQLRPLEDVYLPSSKDFLTEVTAEHQKDYEISCEIRGKDLIVTMSDAVKKEYENIYPVSATRNGARILRFYITEPQDPHVMYEYKSISLADLITSKEIIRELGADLSEHSIYTNRVFDRYMRK